MSFANNPLSLGKLTVTSAGTPISFTSGFSGVLDYGTIRASKLDVQALSTNQNNVYVGYSGMSTTTLSGVVAVLGAGDSWQLDLPDSGNRIDVSKFWLAADTNDDAALVVIYVG